MDTISATSGPYKVSSLHRARITAYNPVDNLFLVSFEQHILDQPFLRLEDIEAGATLEGVVEKVLERHIVVKLADAITGSVPIAHTTDVLPQGPKHSSTGDLLASQKRFKEGKTIKCRV